MANQHEIESMIRNIIKLMATSLGFGILIFVSQDAVSWRSAFIKTKHPPPSQTRPIETIGLADAIMLRKNTSNIFLDARAKRYYEYARIPGSINIPYDQLENITNADLENLRNAPNIVVYCVSTSCGLSYRAARVLMDKGVENVKVYTGGWGQWKTCGLPIESGGEK